MGAQQRTSSVGGQGQVVAERHILRAIAKRVWCEVLGKVPWPNLTHKSHSSKPARATPCDHGTRTRHSPVVEDHEDQVAVDDEAMVTWVPKTVVPWINPHRLRRCVWVGVVCS